MKLGKDHARALEQLLLDANKANFENKINSIGWAEDYYR
jgi:hypothetical protein